MRISADIGAHAQQVQNAVTTSKPADDPNIPRRPGQTDAQYAYWVAHLKQIAVAAEAEKQSTLSLQAQIEAEKKKLRDDAISKQSTVTQDYPSVESAATPPTSVNLTYVAVLGGIAAVFYFKNK